MCVCVCSTTHMPSMCVMYFFHARVPYARVYNERDMIWCLQLIDNVSCVCVCVCVSRAYRIMLRRCEQVDKRTFFVEKKKKRRNDVDIPCGRTGFCPYGKCVYNV